MAYIKQGVIRVVFGEQREWNTIEIEYDPQSGQTDDYETVSVSVFSHAIPDWDVPVYNLRQKLGKVKACFTLRDGDFDVRCQVQNAVIPESPVLPDAFFQEITISPTPVTLRQEHTLVPAPTDQCNRVGIEVKLFDATKTNPEAFTQIQINEQAPVTFAPTNTYIVDKQRDISNFIIRVTAADTAKGESSMLNNTIVPPMVAEPAHTMLFSLLTVESNQGWQYDYGDGGGWVAESSHLYTTNNTYLVKVKDAYGCERSFNVTATVMPKIDLNAFKSHFYVSKANPIRFFEVVTPDDCNIYNNDENTSGCNDIYADIRYFDRQLIKRCLNPFFQFRSGYDSHTIEVFEKDGANPLHSISATVIEQNLNVQDARKFEYLEKDGFTYIYFPDTFKIPYFFEQGLDVSIGGETQTILEKVYLDEKNTWALQTPKFTTYGSNVLITNYNKALYNTLRSQVLEQPLADGEYYIKITASRTSSTVSSENKTVVWQSLNFLVADKFSQTVDILYKNYRNNDMYWTNGFTGAVTIPFDVRVAIGEMQNQVVGTDDDSYLEDSYGREKFSFRFDPLTLEMARKLMTILSQSEVKIDETMYVFDGINISTIGEYTNDYIISAEGYKNMERLDFANTFACGLSTQSQGSGGTAVHRECGKIDPVPTRLVTKIFDKAFGIVPTGVGNLRVYRIVDRGTKKVYENVLYQFPSASWLSATAFTIEIDPSESLTGVVVEYCFY